MGNVKAVYIWHLVTLVQRRDHRYPCTAKLSQQLVCDSDLLLTILCGGITDMDYNVCVCSLLKGGSERLHKVMGQASDKTDRIHQHHLSSVGEGDGS